jgi:hypothetical protein
MLTAGPAYVFAMKPQSTNIPEPMVPPTPMLTKSNKVKCLWTLLTEEETEVSSAASVIEL